MISKILNFFKIKKPNSKIFFDEKSIESFIPPLNINYNSSEKSENEYKKKFIKKYNEFVLPYILDKHKKEYQLPKILDLGCGFSPLGISYLNYLKKTSRDSSDLIYLGVDINKTAIDWLKTKFKNYKNFYFHLHKATQEINYISLGSMKNSDINTLSNSRGEEVKYKIPVNFKPDFQLSASFFTHLTPSAVNLALKFISENSSEKTVSINSWLIIDQESQKNLEKKKCDRTLDIDMGDYLTYSKSNPLLCTAYKLDKIKEFYKKNGLKILEISKGNWSNKNYKNIFNTKQDIIISKKI